MPKFKHHLNCGKNPLPSAAPLIANILFDLDGTLTDSRPGIVACMQHALTTLGYPTPASLEFNPLIGPPLREGLSHLLHLPPQDPQVDQAIEIYRDRFATVGLFENQVYPDIPKGLAALATQHRLFVATSKPRIFAERIIEHFGLSAYFCAVYGSELDGRLAHKGDLIAHILDQAGLRPQETVMVGDRHHDVAGALQNQVFPVGVLWGYGSAAELRQAGVQRLLQAPLELPQLNAPGNFAL